MAKVSAAPGPAVMDLHMARSGALVCRRPRGARACAGPAAPLPPTRTRTVQVVVLPRSSMCADAAELARLKAVLQRHARAHLSAPVPSARSGLGSSGTGSSSGGGSGAGGGGGAVGSSGSGTAGPAGGKDGGGVGVQEAELLTALRQLSCYVLTLE